MMTVYDTLGICKFSRHMFFIEGLPELVNAATGFTSSISSLLTVGERIYNIQRAFNAREGFTRKDDNLPERVFSEPIPKGKSEESVLNREEFEKMLDEYYGVYNARSFLGITKYPKSVAQSSLLITALVETWINMGDFKYRDLAEKTLKWLIGENEFKKDLQSPQGGFYKEIQKTDVTNELSLTTTALALTALINSLLIGIPEIRFIQPVLILTLIITLFMVMEKRLKSNS